MPRRLGGACIALLLIVSGCSSEPTAPGAVTLDEERQLNDAAAMLDANSVSLDTVANDGTAQ